MTIGQRTSRRMTTPLRGTGSSGAHDEVLAGEYVLGALAPDAARQVEARMKRDRHFAAMVRRWQENLSDLDDDASDLWTMPAASNADASLTVASRPVSRNARLPVWRFFGMALFAFVAVYALYEARDLASRPGAKQAVRPLLTPIYDPAAGRVAIDAAKATDPLVRLWLIEKSGKAYSIGEMPAGSSLPLDDAMKLKLAEGGSLAIAPAE